MSITLSEDFASGRNKYIAGKEFIENWDLGADGNRAVFVTRGDIFTVPAKNGPVRPVYANSASHERNANWSPNGKYIAFISDLTGEDEIYIIDGQGTNTPIQLTKGGDNYKYGLSWSPDSKK